jgi:hypothetical protein
LPLGERTELRRVIDHLAAIDIDQQRPPARSAGEARIIVNTTGRNYSSSDDRWSAAIAIARSVVPCFVG